MRSFFSNYVANLAQDVVSDVVTFDRLLERLRKVLIYEMKRRGLWSAPPRYLGIYGGSRWDEGDLLEELLLDCYEFIFVRRLSGLQHRAAMDANVDGFIFLNVQHFLHDTQRQHDPLGYRVFEVVHAAVKTMVGSGDLHVLAGDPKIRNDTVLGFEPWADPSVLTLLDPIRLGRWNDELMPDLVTAFRREAIVERLAHQIAALGEEGQATFSFRQLVEPLKDDARARWMALLFENAEHEESDEGGEALPVLTLSLRAQHGFDEREAYRALLACIRRSINTSAENARAKEYLSRLFDFLHRWSAAHEEGPEAEPVPSDRRLAEALDIPRGRIQELKETLGRLATSCRERSAAPPSPAFRSPTAVRAIAEGPAMSLQERREHLRQRTRRMELPDRDLEPEPGDTFVFPQLETGAEWLLTALQPEGRASLVPIDSAPFVGSRDLELDQLPEGPQVARCGITLRLEAEVLRQARRSRRLGAEVIAHVRAKLKALDTGELAATTLEREVDGDSEYQIWIEHLETASRRMEGEAQKSSGGGSVVPIFTRKPRQRWSPAPSWALAAALALGVIGLSFYNARLQRDLIRTEQPLLVPSGKLEEIRLGSEERGLEVQLATIDGHRLIVYLVFRNVPDFPAYRLRLSNPAGAMLWESGDLERAEHLLIIPVTHPSLKLELLGKRADSGLEILDERRLILETTTQETP